MAQSVQNTSAVQIQRLPTVSNLTGLSRSTIYRRINQSLFPRPIPIGGDRVGWLSTEVEAINKARISGKSDDQIKLLVSKLEAARGAI